MIRALLICAVILISGCKTISSNPIQITCKGKGTITGTGYAGGTAALGVHEANAFSISADCGPEGFEYSQGAPAAK
jgi:Na+-transporting NADH:ubiquinone oxidoreductase subunit NqrF